MLVKYVNVQRNMFIKAKIHYVINHIRFVIYDKSDNVF